MSWSLAWTPHARHLTNHWPRPIAYRIHAASPRASQVFVAVNCGAMSPDLASSELFGHKRGAFTGAVTERKGHFQEASGGTLFLDEIGDLPADTQVRLLRALQTGEVTPLGSSKPIKVIVRIIAATHRDLAADVAAGRFREDLFHRLAVGILRLSSAVGFGRRSNCNSHRLSLWGRIRLYSLQLSATWHPEQSDP